jgi:hypothetical protein
MHAVAARCSQLASAHALLVKLQLDGDALTVEDVTARLLKIIMRGRRPVQ